MIRVMFVVIGMLLCLVGYEAYRVHVAKERSEPVLSTARVFEKTEGVKMFLVAGDSTGVGTGAEKPEDSVAGRLSKDFPDASVTNVSKNGMKVAGLLETLRELPEEKKYEIVLLQIGGNDILQFTPDATVERDIRLVFGEAKKRGERVFFMSTGDVGSAPAFGPVLSFLFSARTKELRQMFIEESEKAGIVYVDLYLPRAEDPFVKESKTYHSADGLHPSSIGYGFWYDKLKGALK